MHRIYRFRSLCLTLAIAVAACGGILASDTALGNSGFTSFLLKIVAPGYKIVNATPDGAGGASVVYDAQNNMSYTVGLNWASALRVQPAVHDVSVTAYGTCRYLDNNSGKVFLVPFKQQSEWRSFISAGAIPNKFALDFCRMPMKFGSVDYASALSDKRNLFPASQPTSFAVADAAIKRIDSRSTAALKSSLAPESRPHAFNMKRIDCLGNTTYPDGTTKNPCNTWSWVEQLDARFTYLPFPARTYDDTGATMGFINSYRTSASINEIGQWQKALIHINMPPAVQPPVLRNCAADNQSHNAVYWIDQGTQSVLADCGAGMISDANDPRRRSLIMQAEYRCFDGTRYQNSYPTTETREKPGSAQLLGQCLPIVNGSCGTANNSHPRSLTDGSAGLCASGSVASFTAASDSWAWTCAGANTGTNTSCAAAIAVDAVCGTANAQPASTAPASTPATNLCAIGNASAVASAITGGGPFTWTCQSTQGGSDATCATTAPVQAGSWAAGAWSSYGTCVNGSQTRTRNVACVAAGATVADSLCAGAGTRPAASESQSCDSTPPVTTPPVTTPPVTTTPVVPACGAAAGTAVLVAPTSGLCSAGDASAVTGTGPFTWSCSATNAQTATCSTIVQASANTAAIKIGMNLAGLGNASRELPFIDYLKISGDDLLSGISLSIPIALGPVDLVLTYEGSTAVSVYAPNANTANAIGWNNVQATGFAPGRVTFHSEAGGSINLNVTHTDLADPIRNVHLMRVQDEAAFAAGEIFNPDFVNFIKQFSLLRTMDWTCTNGNQVANWADRPKLTDHVWGCAPIEVQVALANKVNSDLWLNIPAHVDDDYIRQATTYVRDNLRAGLKLHLEYSNEVWNGGFEQQQYAAAQGSARWTDNYFPAQEFQGYRSAQMMNIAKQVFGAGAATRLVGIWATFTWWTGPQMDDAFEQGVLHANVGTISDLFKEYAVTTYFGDALGYFPGNEPDRPIVLSWATSGAAGLDKTFQQLEHGGLLTNDFSLDSLKPVYAIHKTRAAKWGLDLVSYEGGPSWYYFAAPDKGPFDPYYLNILNDPRMKALQKRSLTDFAEAGGVMAAHFNDVGRTGIFGPWPIIEGLGDTSPRLEALQELNTRR